ncbi:MAG: hypothetical protein ABIH42_11365, partial [Planctomycetota bacterium]
MDFDFQPYVDASRVLETYLPGDTISIQVGLRDPSNNAFVKDPALIKDIDVLVLPVGPNGVYRELTAIKFDQDTNEAKKDYNYLINEKAIGGVWDLNVSFGIIKYTLTEKYAYISDPVHINHKVISPVIEVTPSVLEGYIGQKIPLTGKITVGSVSQTDIDKMPFSLDVSNELSALKATATIDYDKQTETFSGTLDLNGSGDWKIDETPANAGKIIAPTGTIIKINDRDLNVFQLINGEKKEVTELITSSQTEIFKEDIIIEPTLAASEVAELSLAYTQGSGKEKDVALFTTETVSEQKEPKYEVNGEKPTSNVVLKLQIEKPLSAREPVGTVVVTYNVTNTDVSITKEIPVICVPIPKEIPIWVFIVGGIVLLALIAFLVWFLTLPDFGEHRIVMVSDGSTYYLREMKIKRTMASGTEHAQGSLLFRLKRPKSAPKCDIMPKPGFQVAVDGEPKTAEWSQLSNGCEIASLLE